MDKAIFLSHVLHENTICYGGSSGVKIEKLKSVKNGDSSNTHEWKIHSHAGTHVDSPRHFFDDGMAIDDFNPEFWVCETVNVLECEINEGRQIACDDVPAGSISESVECILIRTGFQKYKGSEKYHQDNPGISPDLAVSLRSNYPKLKFIGVDFISISRYKERELGRQSHRELLKMTEKRGPVLPIEDMDLSAIRSGCAIRGLLVAPIRIEGADGSPVTVIGYL